MHVCRHGETRGSLKVAIRSLARQLAQQMKPYAIEIVRNKQCALPYADQDLPELFDHLLLRPLLKIASDGKPIFLLIDAVDECQVRHEQGVLEQLLADRSKLPQHVHFVFSSVVQVTLQRSAALSIPMDDATSARGDLRPHARQMLETSIQASGRVSSLDDNLARRTVEWLSQTNFQYVACLAGALEDVGNERGEDGSFKHTLEEILTMFPHTLNGLYEFYLNRVFKRCDHSEGNVQLDLCAKLVGIVVAMPTTLAKRLVATLLDPNTTFRVGVSNVLQYVKTLLQAPPTIEVKFHSTLLKWLTGDGISATELKSMQDKSLDNQGLHDRLRELLADRGSLRASGGECVEGALVTSGLNHDYSECIQHCATTGQIALAKKLLRSLTDAKRARPTPEMYETMLKAYMSAEHADVDAMVETWTFMRKESWLPSLPTCMSMIIVCGQSDNLTQATEVFDAVLECGTTPNVILFNIMLHACAKGGALTSAETYFTAMEAAGVQPNEVTFNTMINGHCKANDVNGAERWFTKMEAAGVQPDVLNFTTLLKAVSLRGDLARCIQLFTLMVDSGLRPNEYTFVALFFTCSRASRRHPEWALEWALEWFRDFASRGLTLNQHVANAFERCVDEWTAQDLYRQHDLTVVQAGRKKDGRGKGGSGKGGRGKGGRGKGAQVTTGGIGFCFTFSNHGRCSHGSNCRYFANTPGHNQESGKSHVSVFIVVPSCMASALTWPHVSAAHVCTGHNGKGKPGHKGGRKGGRGTGTKGRSAGKGGFTTKGKR